MRTFTIGSNPDRERESLSEMVSHGREAEGGRIMEWDSMPVGVRGRRGNNKKSEGHTEERDDTETGQFVVLECRRWRL